MKIGEVAEKTGLDISTIRFYERKELIAPARIITNSYRSYTQEDIKCLDTIVLYRKMDLSLEQIRNLLQKNANLQGVLKEQINTLKEEREHLDGALSLCQKMIDDQADISFDVKYYLNYVKTKEAEGRKYPDIMGVIDRAVEQTDIDGYLGLPISVYFMRYTWVRRLFGMISILFLTVFPLVMIAEWWMRWRHNQTGLLSILIWVLLMIFFWGISIEIVRRGKGSKP